ncbi:phage major capsid protein [Marinifilum flexuosum]|uniref:HK97 family phage major capsid protein n=1 Tax=Marinifilum flexuosum TaxID=1117708 RepID=A0A419WMX3_9BACT|nr:phage major capsid protein [Marinifilum flexuosum]RKD96778.1 HK97 family phage major capsid protein [Marinifilum flexuosum]
MKQKFAIVASVIIALLLIVAGLPVFDVAAGATFMIAPVALIDIENNIRNFKEQRGDCLDKMDALVDVQLSEKRSLTEDETTKYNEYRSKADELKGQIEMLEVSLESRKAKAKAEGKEIEGKEERKTEEEAEKRYNEAFKNWAVGGEARCSKEDLEILDSKDKEMRAMGTGTGSAGGYLAPTSMATKIEEALKYLGGVRAGATVMTTENGNTINYPTMDDTTNMGELIGENPTDNTNEQDIAFGNKQIGAYTYSSKAIPVSNELLQDSAFDLEGYIARVAAQRIFKITNQHYTTGDGTNKPKGFLQDATLGLTAAGTNAIVADELVKLLHKVDSSYRQNGKWMFNDNTLLAIRLLKDNDGRPLWQPGMVDGAPNTILGKPYIINNDMPDIATGAKAIAFGDIEKYLIRDVTNASLKRLGEINALKNQTVFVLFSRHDGALIDAGTHPIKYLQLA